MSLWTRILQAIDALTSGAALSDIFETLTRPPEKTVAFTIAVIGLGAKMAKADGRVSRSEVIAFREVFHIPPEDEQNAARLFNLARQDVRGYDAYARSIARMFRSDPQMLTDLFEGLFYIACADGELHPLEETFLRDVAQIFGFDERQYSAIRSRAVPGANCDPYAILGVTHEDDMETIKRKWQDIVRETHPDQMLARGVPEEAIKLASNRLIAVNDAWEKIRAERAA